MADINKLLKQQIELIKPDKPALSKIKTTAEQFCLDLRRKLKQKKIIADVFIGGSLAKNTLVKKEKQDIDIFIRFDKKHEGDNISKLLGKILGKKAKKLHGSRDYYQIVINEIIIEVVPVMKVRNPQEAANITDLSYFHVNYVRNKIKKNKKLSDEILLAKTFAHACNCYGAESYIHGFSGYALELLICHYGSFLNFIRNIVKHKESKGNDEKIIIDDKKFYRNKNQILIEMNESKIQSPIILVDPTFKERNALAGLSYETFEKFKKSCRNFLKMPDLEFFKTKDIGKELGKKYGKKLNIIKVKTNKQAGDIAGTKSRKFFIFFKQELIKEFKIKETYFDYHENKNIAYFYFLLENKKPEIIRGPHVTKVVNLSSFKKKHKNAFIKNHFAYVKIKHNLSFKMFYNLFLKKYRKIIKQMNIKKMELVNFSFIN